MIRFWITVVGDFESEALWNEVSSYKVNVLDMDDGKIHCYGDATPTVFASIVEICTKFNKHFSIEITAP